MGFAVWTTFALAYLVGRSLNRLVSLVFYGHKTEPVGRLTVIAMAIIVFSSLITVLFWRTFSRRDFTDDAAQGLFMRCFVFISVVMLVFYAGVLIDFMFVRRFMSGDRIRVILPIPFETVINQLFYLDLTPFEIFCQLAGNLFLLTPVGFAVKSCIFAGEDRPPSEEKPARAKDFLIRHRRAAYILLPFALSLFFETVQYIFAVGYSDIDDLLFNVAGYFLGGGFLSLLNLVRKRRTRGLDKNLLRRVK